LWNMQGVVGVYSRRDAARKALHILFGVQHRGQESAGMSVAGDHSLRSWRGEGLVSKVFTERFKSFTHPDDYAIIGCASGESVNHVTLPPLEIESERYKLSLALDGHIHERGERLNEEVFGGSLLTRVKSSGITEALEATMRELESSYYSVVIAVLDKQDESSYLLVARDPRGVKPLFVGYNDGEMFVASESAPLDVLESMGETLTKRHDLKPGSYIMKGDDTLLHRQVIAPKPAHCAFEWVYFARPDSVIEGRNVHSARKRLGHALVETHKLKELYDSFEGESEDTVLIPVPDSGRSVCIGVAEALGVSADEGVIKNAYLGRTYIIDDPDYRKVASDLKHNIIKETVQGKRVIITDDSIVRGTVSESVAQNLLKAGASEVEFLVSYAPIFHRCFSDPPDKPLAAASYEGKSLEEIGALVAEKLPSINRVKFNSTENIERAIGLPNTGICTYCITGKNPFEE